MKSVATPPVLLLASCKRFIVYLFAIVLIGLGMASGQEKDAAAVPQQGVELLFPAGTGKRAKDAKLSKEQKKAAALIQKLKAIEKGGDVNTTDKLGQTALMHAAAQGNRLAVCWLVAKGADASIKSKKGKTAGDLVHEGDKRMKKLLQVCCEEKLPAPSSAEMEEQGIPSFLSQYSSKESSQEQLETREAWRGHLFGIAMTLRAGARAEKLHPDKNEFLFTDYPPESLAFLVRHGMPVQPCSETKWDEGSPEHLRLLLALGMPKTSKDVHTQLLFALLLDNVGELKGLLQQKPDEAGNPALYGQARSSAAVHALAAAAGGVPDASACLKAILQTSYSGGAVKGLLESGVPVPQDKAITSLILPDRVSPGFFWYDDDGSRFTDNSYQDYIFTNIRRSEPDVLQVLLDAGLDPNLTFSNGYSLLHRAAKLGRAAVVEVLLKHGANPNALDKGKRTPLSLIFVPADDEGYYAPNTSAIVQSLLTAGADPKLGQLDSLLISLIGQGDIDFPRSEEGQREDVSALRALLRAGLKVPTDILLNFQGGQRQRLSDAQYEEVALLLLEHGADPLVTDNDGKTTLMTAGRMGPRIAQKLLDAGVDPVVVSKRGETALKSALAQNQPEVAKLLHDKGARYSGDLFICHPDCMQIMLDDGAKVPPSICEELLNHGSALYSCPFTLEQYARIIELLKKAGADIQHTLVQNNRREIPSLRVLKAFLKCGADPSATDDQGNNGLMLLIASGNATPGLIQAFLNAGANPNHKNKDGKSILQLAKEQKLGNNIIQLLQEHGAKE